LNFLRRNQELVIQPTREKLAGDAGFRLALFKEQRKPGECFRTKVSSFRVKDREERGSYYGQEHSLQAAEMSESRTGRSNA
jgi:hypothetical protein